MEELHAAAWAYYNRGNYDTHCKAYDFFRSMDTDGDYRISFAEFNDFVQQSGYNWILHNDPNLFARLDRNRDGHLDFWEVLTFYYIIKTRLITCQSCRAHLCGLYFTCVDCFDEGCPTYDLCAACYGNANYFHQHNYFLDNHVLLRSQSGTPHDPPNLTMNRWYEAFVALEIALSISALATNCTIITYIIQNYKKENQRAEAAYRL
ncbi:hypothetical protein CerSpe_005150 [Prunus speciosa]